MGSPCRFHPPAPIEKVKFFTYGAILLKFETQQFHTCTNNNWDYDLDMGSPNTINNCKI